MPLYPLVCNLTGRLAVIIGGGSVALRKARDLLTCGARLRIISPEIDNDLQILCNEHRDRIDYINRAYRKGDLHGAILAYSATNNSSVNRQVFQEAEETNILFNAVDDPDNCSFYVPSWVSRGDLLIALSTSGASPAMAARLRRSIEKVIPEGIEDILRALRSLREILKEDPDFSALSADQRGGLLKKIANDDTILDRSVELQSTEQLKEYVKQILQQT